MPARLTIQNGAPGPCPSPPSNEPCAPTNPPTCTGAGYTCTHSLYYSLEYREKADWDRGIELAEYERPADQRLYRSERAMTLARLGRHARATAEANGLSEQASIADGTLLYQVAGIYALSHAAVLIDPNLPQAERPQFAEQYAARARQSRKPAAVAELIERPADEFVDVAVVIGEQHVALDVLGRVYVRWERICRDGDPHPYVRRCLVRLAEQGWARQTRSEEWALTQAGRAEAERLREVRA